MMNRSHLWLYPINPCYGCVRIIWLRARLKLWHDYGGPATTIHSRNNSRHSHVIRTWPIGASSKRWVGLAFGFAGSSLFEADFETVCMQRGSDWNYQSQRLGLTHSFRKGPESVALIFSLLKIRRDVQTLDLVPSRSGKRYIVLSRVATYRQNATCAFPISCHLIFINKPWCRHNHSN